MTRVRDSAKYTHLEITLTEGRNRQVRRMIEALGAKVLKLVRVRIGAIGIGALPIGKWRPLTSAELDTLIPSSTCVEPERARDPARQKRACGR